MARVEADPMEQPPPASETAPPKKKKTGTPLPSPPSATVRFDQFCDYTAKLTPDQWAHAMWYMWRVWPVIHRQPHSNIDKGSAPMTEEYVLSQHGGGTYELRFNDLDLKHDATIMRVKRYEVPPDQHPPKLRLDELVVSHPSNKGYVDKLVAEGKLTPEGIPVTPNQPQDLNSALKTALDFAERMNKAQGGAKDFDLMNATLSQCFQVISTANQESLKMALAQIRPQDPDALLKQLEQAKRLFDQPRPANGEGTPLLIEMLREDLKAARAEAAEERRANRELTLKLLERKDEKTDPLEMVDRVLGIRERLANSDLGGGPPDWKTMGMGLVAQNSPAVGRLFDALAVNLRGRTQSPPAQTGTVTGPTTIAQAEPATAIPTPTNPELQDPQLEYLTVLFSRYGHYFMNAFVQNQSGQAFADAIISFAGQMEYEKIQNCGKEKLKQALQRFPELWKDLSMVEPQLDIFIEDFLAGPEEPEEPPPPDTPKKRKAAVPPPGAAA